jgi:hypothetical protein
MQWKINDQTFFSFCRIGNVCLSYHMCCIEVVTTVRAHIEAIAVTLVNLVGNTGIAWTTD